jgi:hypothetical protein
VRYLKFVRTGDKFAAVPKAGCSFNSKYVSDQCYGKYEPASEGVDSVKFRHE